MAQSAPATPSPARRTSLAALSLPLLLGASSCIAVFGNRGFERADLDRSAADGQDEACASGKADEEEPEALRAARHQISVARHQVQLREAKAAAALFAAREDLRQAEEALAAWLQHEGPKEREGAEIDLERTRNRLIDTRMELEELEAMYAGDDFAETTKELVLSRGRRNLVLAERAAALSEQRFAYLTEQEQPRKERALERALEEARAAKAALEIELAIAELESSEALRKAEHALGELEQGKGKQGEGEGQGDA